MTPEEAICNRILDLGAVTALVSQRVYQLKLPQSVTLPAVRVQEIDEGTSYHHRGGTSMYISRIQVDAYAEESGGDPYGGVQAVAQAIHGDDAGSGLSGWQGFVGGSPPSLKVHAIFRVLRRQGYESEELRELRCQQDYMVHWSPMT